MSSALSRREETAEGEERRARMGETMEGIASIALLPCGSVSGHFIKLPESSCYGLHGTELACERECSRGEDYRLIKLTISDYSSNKEEVVVVECRGHDAARFRSIDNANGWGEDVAEMVEQKHGKQKISVSFECETLKAESAAEEHVRRFMPKISGLDAVVNVGRMSISGLSFQVDQPYEEQSSQRRYYHLPYAPI
ncbi:unnamed protein product [Spirodela intermedia]|uniref:Uncharacterized protein n=1 Tax=Spirodela intermedia TaxID=51605 RepID=A0A7I8I7G9_SPIIN|nr:unnamed protein product [Spirodela intermedia]CAA6653536.1 unnamed protein product [Spirodela intermedia]